MFEERYQKLNLAQKEAVDQVFGPMLVVAGPGTGKTELLSIRTANILKVTDTSPSSILLLTFTESGAENMRERLVALIGETAYKINIFTFHAFASYIISQNRDIFFDGHAFEPAADIDQLQILENIFKNLDKDDPLSSYHPELGFAYLKDVAQSIKDLKRGNLNPKAFLEILLQNKKEASKLKKILEPLDNLGGKRKYLEVVLSYIKVLENLKKIKNNGLSIAHTNKLEKYLELSRREEKTTPLTEWKNRYTEKTETDTFIFKEESEERQNKLFSLQKIYEMYQDQLYQAGKYDFDDMILLFNNKLKQNNKLRADLKERFQFIMVDEFQDTNDAQFQIFYELCKDEELPNILAVGDDDQAIFKFQGAEINNIKKFLNVFDNVKIITLKENYRSSQEILDYSRKVILKGEERLENFDKSINKELQSKGLHRDIKNKIIEKSFEDEILEFDYIGEEISKLLQSGELGSEIAIICRKHENLKKIANFLHSRNIPLEYEKENNIFSFQLITQILKILKFLVSYSKNKDESLLAEILAFPMFKIERLSLWRELEKNEQEKFTLDEFGKKIFSEKSLLSGLLESEDLNIKMVAGFLKNLILDSKNLQLPKIIDQIIGDNHSEDIEYQTEKQEATSSWFKDYYFTNKNDKNYIENLLALKTFVEAVREYKQKEEIYIEDFSKFINLYESKNINLSLRTPFKSGEHAVQILTAHKSKGLEFKYVFLIGTDDSTWKKAGVTNKISYPINLPLGPSADNDDDKLRLLYVALTRSKFSLYITHSNRLLEYLVNEESQNSSKTSKSITNIGEELLANLNANQDRFSLEEKAYLTKKLETYKMPVTHLINFLNYPKIGPEKFIEQNILRYPQSMTGASAYGSAMHSSLEKYFLYFNKYNKKADLNFLLNSFEKSLWSMRLTTEEFRKYLKAGENALKVYAKYLDERGILKNTKVEVKFAQEGVNLGMAKLTGNIDKMEFIDDEVIVTDMKTGSQVDSWEPKGSDWEKTKMHFYKYQLIFYKILIENSINFSKYKCKVCALEFIEPTPKGEIVNLPLRIEDTEKERLEKLVKIVYNKIKNLNFPDTSKYEANYKGILKFEEDLLSEVI